MEAKTQSDRLLRYIRDHGMIRARDMDFLGASRMVLKRLVDQGRVEQRARGVYTAVDHESTRHADLAEICARTPAAVVCLLSALDLHELTTQIPHAVWIMIDRACHRPRIKQPPIRVVLASGASLSAGVTVRQIEGVKVRVTDPAKTVADCFKYRRHVGLDVAVEALRDCLRQRRATPGQIFDMARIDRVGRIVRPYIEALT